FHVTGVQTCALPIYFTLLRREDGRLELERAPRRGAAADLALLLPRELEIAVRDSRVVYVDAARGVNWSFTDVALELERGGRTLRSEERRGGRRCASA